MDNQNQEIGKIVDIREKVQAHLGETIEIISQLFHSFQFNYTSVGP